MFRVVATTRERGTTMAAKKPSKTVETKEGEAKPSGAKPSSETTQTNETLPDAKAPAHKSKERDSGYSHAEIAAARETVQKKTGRPWATVAAMNDAEVVGEVARLNAQDGVKAEDAKS